MQLWVTANNTAVYQVIKIVFVLSNVGHLRTKYLFLKKTLSKKSPTLPFPFQLQLPSRAIVNTVERYAASLSKDQIITAVNDILPRAQARIESDGGAFDS